MSNTDLALRVDEGGVPYVQQDLLELGEALVSQDVAPLIFQVEEQLLHQEPDSMTTLGEPDDTGSALVRHILPLDVSQTFEALEQLVHRLFAHAGPLCQDAGADAIGTR